MSYIGSRAKIKIINGSEVYIQDVKVFIPGEAGLAGRQGFPTISKAVFYFFLQVKLFIAGYRDWAGELISGQSVAGRVLVPSSSLLDSFFINSLLE